MRAAVLVFTVGSLVAGCGTDYASPGVEAGAPDASIPPACLEARNHSDLAWLETNLFKPNCSASSSCHKGTARQAGELNLEPGRVHAAVVNVRSDLFPDYDLVVPGEPATSYLMILMDHTKFPGPLEPTVGTMPFSSPPLCVEKREAVERWIAAGAPDVEGAIPDAGPVDAGASDAGPADAAPAP